MNNSKFLPIQADDLNNPFVEDKLDREKLAPVLKGLVEFFGGVGGTIALNGSWGSGKTSFVKMWKKWMEKDGYRVLYFDAWSTDYIEDPMLGLFGELQEIIPDEPTYDEIFNHVGKFCKVAVKGIIKYNVSKYVGPDIAGTSVDELLSQDNNIGEYKKALKEYSGITASMDAFQKCLCEAANSISDKPLVFIVDELDRCKPDYAVKVLERIKHFFSIPNIVFVLAIDKSQLCNAIKGFYGSERINAEEYLKRFIDAEFPLPEADVNKLCSFAYDYFGIKEEFEDYKCVNFGIGKEQVYEFNILLSYIIFFKKYNIRDVEKFVSHYKLTLRSILEREKANDGCKEKKYSGLTLLLVYLHKEYREFFDKIEKHTLSIQELANEYEKIFKIEEINNGRINKPGYLYDIYAQLLVGYNEMERLSMVRLTIDADKNNRKLVFNTSYPDDDLVNMVSQTRFIALDVIIDRVKLLDYIV